MGSDADIVIWNGDAVREISAKTHHHAVDFNIFEGLKVHGVCEITISRGLVVWENNQLFTQKGHGKFVPRGCWGPVFDGIQVRDRERDEIKRKVDRPPYSGPVVVLK